MRIWVEGLFIPLISGISEHESLITCSHVKLVFLTVNSSSDVGILSVDVQDNVAVIGVESNVVTGETNFLADSSSNLLEINFSLVDRHFSEKNNLKIKKKDVNFENN